MSVKVKSLCTIYLKQINKRKIMAMQLYVMNLQQNRRLPKPRVFRDITSPLDTLTDAELIARYRLPRHCIVELCDVIQPDLQRSTQRSHPMSVMTQVLTALRFYATGLFQKDVADLHGISQPSVSRAVTGVSAAIARVAKNYIALPASNLTQIMKDFGQLADMPNVVGCIDGTQIPISAPHDNEHLYVCRKGFHAINVQVVCDAQLRLTNIVAKWPGSTHDSFMWTNSALYQRMRANNMGWLLGDSGYPLSPVLLTPVARPSSRAEEEYNTAHKRTRNTVERAIGLLKMRFRCLHKTGGCLQSPPETCVIIITACAVLHNICINSGMSQNESELTQLNDEQEEEEGQEEGQENQVEPSINHASSDRENGRSVRSRLIAQRYTH